MIGMETDGAQGKPVVGHGEHSRRPSIGKTGPGMEPYAPKSADQDRRAMPNCGLEEHAGAGTEHNECGKTKRDGQRCPRLGRQGPGTGYLRGVGTAKRSGVPRRRVARWSDGAAAVGMGSGAAGGRWAAPASGTQPCCTRTGRGKNEYVLAPPGMGGARSVLTSFPGPWRSVGGGVKER